MVNRTRKFLGTQIGTLIWLGLSFLSWQFFDDKAALGVFIVLIGVFIINNIGYES